VHRFLTRIENWLSSAPITVRRAGTAIAAVTIVVTIASGILMRVFDHRDFPTVAEGLWWATQTVTTVGYGDVVPTNAVGKVIAVVVMVAGIAFVTVVTAAITAAFVESGRRRYLAERDQGIEAKLDEISRRLAGLEGAERGRDG
jgi:voltage-gated potassium channel